MNLIEDFKKQLKLLTSLSDPQITIIIAILVATSNKMENTIKPAWKVVDGIRVPITGDVKIGL